MSLVVIINPVSGGDGRHRGRERAEQAAAVLASMGRTAEICVTERRGHARELAAAAVARGATLVCSWGGDGTMNEVGSALVRSATALALIPSGSGNGLARTLAVPLDPARALVAACQAAPRQIDAGRCGDEWFFSVAGVGFDAHVAAGFDRDGHARRGLRTYVSVAAASLLRYRARRYRIYAAGEAGQAGQASETQHIWVTRPALLVTVANAAQFGNGAWIAPDAVLDDGRLDLVVVEERSRLASLRAVPRLFNKTIARAPGVTIRRVTEVVIESGEPEEAALVPYHLDGEPREGRARLEFAVAPGAIRVCART